MSITHLILSGGQSSRMGKPKALVSWHGQSFLERAVEAAKKSGAKDIFVILGAHYDEIKWEATRLNIGVVKNENWNSGMGSSIKIGLNAILECTPKTEGVLIQLIDQPLVAGDHLICLKSEFKSRKIIASKFGLSFGPPVLFAASFFQDLLAISDSVGAKKVIQDHFSSTLLIDMPEAQTDIDTPEELTTASCILPQEAKS